MAIYLKLDGVEGASEKKGHEKWIEVLSWNWGASNMGSGHYGSGMSAETTQIQDMALTCVGGGKSSLQLLHFLTKGQHFKELELHVTKAVGDNQEETWMTIKSDSVFLTMVSFSEQKGMAESLDNITIQMANYMHNVKAQETAGGALKSQGDFGFDMMKNDVK